MSRFTLRKIEAIHGRCEFYELTVDGNGQIESFGNGLQTVYSAEYKNIFVLMKYVAMGSMLPKNKYRNITPDKESVAEFELKTKHLRFYGIHAPNGKIIILAGFKTSQKTDINKFRNLKKLYLNDHS